MRRKQCNADNTLLIIPETWSHITHESSEEEQDIKKQLESLLLTSGVKITFSLLASLLTVLDEHESHVAATAVLTVALVSSHKSIAARGHALSAQTSDLAVTINLVVVENSKLHALMLVGNTLGGGVDLLLVLLATTKQTENKVEGALLLDVVVSKSVTVLELLAGEDKTLLIRGDTLLILDLSLHIVDGITGLNLKSDGLARKSLNENLHDEISLTLTK